MATADSPASPAASSGLAQDMAVSLEQARLGVLLSQRGLLTPIKLLYARQKNRVEDTSFGRLLIRHGLANESDIVRTQAEMEGIEYASVDTLPSPDPQVLALFNRELCQLRQFLPLRRNGDQLEVLLGDADMAAVQQVVLQRCGLRCRLYQGEYSKVSRLIRQTYYFAQNPIEALLEKEIRRLSADNDHAYSPEKTLDYLLHYAVRERTTDIHISPSEHSLHVLFRIDGVLRPMWAMPHSLGRLIGYIKLAAEMDISEQRRPQDGSFRATVLDSPITVRVSTIITNSGERTVMRLLPEQSDLAGLEEMGFFPEDVATLERLF